MRRRLFSIAAIASMLLFAILCTLWIRSYWRMDRFGVMRQLQGPPIDPQLAKAMDIYTQQGLSPPRERYWKDVTHEIVFSRGRFAFAREYDWCFPGRGVEWTNESGPTLTHDSSLPRELFKLLSIQGFDATGEPMRREQQAVEGSWTLSIPIAATLPLPIIWIAISGKKRRRLARGQCVACGYDLRASPDRCPECGAVGSRAGSDLADAVIE